MTNSSDRSLCGNHPYTNLPENSYWKTAISGINTDQINLAWKPKSAICRNTKIVTAGSCFAQHISRSLKQNGFQWIESESPPADLKQKEREAHGYGVFSFRTGNIYTAALLKQWVMWATGDNDQNTEYFFEDGRYFDPFRPSLIADGFSSAQEMLEARKTTLRAMLETIRQADVFIFTLGLTEAWLNKQGLVYPMCPGTVRGSFVPEEHQFHNYTEQEVGRDLSEALNHLHRINPNLRFLLTVSPVPLTATASGQHVLTATTYSKSVLRSAAGRLAQDRGDVDYFPSYELITSPAFKGLYFEPNMRSVSSHGVAFVMGQFLSALGVGVLSAAHKNSVSDASSVLTDVKAIETGTEICDDIILEAWANKQTGGSSELPNILLIGDSHMGMIAKAFDEQGIRYAGGAIMNSSDWYLSNFELRSDSFLFKPKCKDLDVRWDQVCSEYLAKISTDWIDSTVCITNVGNHTCTPLVSGHFETYIRDVLGESANTISSHLIWGFVQRRRVKHLMLVRKLVETGFKVIWVTDPPTQEGFQGLHEAIDSVLCELFAETGCNIMSARMWINELGGLPPGFRSSVIDLGTNRPDWVHGSPEYYGQLANEIFSRFSIVPQYNGFA